MDDLLDKKTTDSPRTATIDASDKHQPAQSFDYLAPDSARRLPSADSTRTIELLDALGEAMVDEGDSDLGGGDADFAPVYTYWGQFIDHDISKNTDSHQANKHSGGPTEFDIGADDFKPVEKSVVRRQLRNARTRHLDLDSVYGDGPGMDVLGMYSSGDPARHCHDGLDGALALGLAKGVGGSVPGPDNQDICRDLPRQAPRTGRAERLEKALMVEPRNDENLIVAQFHTAFLRFHNRALQQLKSFERAREQTRWHYQWLVLHDFLPTVARADIVEAVLIGDRRFDFSGDFMPLEFSTAAYRFGHTMVRSSYDFNANFGRGRGGEDRAGFEQMFRFTGHSSSIGFDSDGRLPSNWIADWSRLAVEGERFNDGLPERFARRIDTRLSDPLGAMLNEGNNSLPTESGMPSLQALMKHLAKRNLRRGYLLQIPTGQEMARLAGLEPLDDDELLSDPLGDRRELNRALRQDSGALLRDTPLWFYILKEAEVREQGKRLGALGSQLVAETLIGLMANSADSVLSHAWQPSNSLLTDGTEIRSIAAFLRFARVL